MSDNAEVFGINAEVFRNNGDVNKNMVHLLHPVHLKDFQQIRHIVLVYSLLYRCYMYFGARIIVQKCAHPILYKSAAVTSYNGVTYQHKGYRL